LLITPTGDTIRVALEESFSLGSEFDKIKEMIWIVLPKPMSSARMPPLARGGGVEVE
jgi:hypothetical protein